MPHLSRHFLAVVICCFVWGCLGPAANPACADDAAPELSIRGPAHEQRHAFPPARGTGRQTGGTTGWWVGTVGVALALAVFGAISLASRRLNPGRSADALAVVGHVSLSPKHTVYLLRAGDRVLIVGAGSQGPPTLLGEWTGPIDRWPGGAPLQPPAAPGGSRSERPMGDEP